MIGTRGRWRATSRAVDPDCVNTHTARISGNDSTIAPTAAAIASGRVCDSDGTPTVGGAFGGAVSEAEILGDVWAQEPQIRQDTTEWLYAFLMLAYGPATEVEMQEYVAFSKSPAGRELNRALFAAYDEMLTEISRDLGASAARLMAGQEI